MDPPRDDRQNDRPGSTVAPKDASPWSDIGKENDSPRAGMIWDTIFEESQRVA
jgi:hypothetical protein